MRALTPTDLAIPWLVFPNVLLWKEPGTQEGLYNIPTLDTCGLGVSSWRGPVQTLTLNERWGGVFLKCIPQFSLEES